MGIGVVKKIKGMLATAFLCHVFIVIPSQTEGGSEQVCTVEQQSVSSLVVVQEQPAPVSPKVVKEQPVDDRPSLHKKFYIKCDDIYSERVKEFLLTATHEQVIKYLEFVVDELTLQPQDDLTAYDHLYIDNAYLALKKLYDIFDSMYIDPHTGEISDRPGYKKLLDCYLENQIESALKFYAVCADYAFAFIYFYFMLPVIAQYQLYEIDNYYNVINTIITDKFSLWPESGNGPQSYINYYQEAFKRVGRLFMRLPDKLERK